MTGRRACAGIAEVTKWQGHQPEVKGYGHVKAASMQGCKQEMEREIDAFLTA